MFIELSVLENLKSTIAKSNKCQAGVGRYYGIIVKMTFKMQQAIIYVRQKS